MVTPVSSSHRIHDGYPHIYPTHPHGSTVGPHCTQCCMPREGSFLNLCFQAEEHFLQRFQRKATKWTFQEEKQITCNITQGRWCHKASQRSGASSLIDAKKKKKKRLYPLPALKKHVNLSVMYSNKNLYLIWRHND